MERQGLHKVSACLFCKNNCSQILSAGYNLNNKLNFINFGIWFL